MRLLFLWVFGFSSTALFAQQKIHPDLAAQAATGARLRVIVVLRDQPHREVAERVGAAAAARVEGAESEYRRLLNQPLALDPIVEAARTRRDEAVIETRREILRQVDAMVGPVQRGLMDRLARLGAQQVRGYQVTNAIAADIPAAALADLEASPEVAEVWPDQEHQALLNISVPTLGAPTFWTGGITGAGQAVGVLDSGVFSGNPAFSGVNVVDQPFGDAASTGSCFNDTPQSASDAVGHGTHVAGTIAGHGSADFPAYLGVARGLSTVYNLKVGWAQTTNSSGCKGGASAFNSDVLAAINWAVQNSSLRIFNYSYGGKATADDDGNTRLMDQIADNFNVTLVISAGNNGPDGSSLNTPGVGYNNLSVAAMNDAKTPARGDDSVASFSSRGPTAGGRSKPDIAAPGQVIFAAAYNSNGLIGMQGTSMAAPHVTGAAVLLNQLGVSDPLAIKAVLINSADGLGWAPDLGWGYANLTTAFQHHDYAKDTLAGGGLRYYRGTAAGVFKSTLTWNRHIGAAGNGTASLFNPLHLYLYSRGNNTLLGQQESGIDNVKQVSTNLAGDVIVKVKAGAATLSAVGAEPYVLAFSSSGFSPINGPVLSASCAAPSAVAPGAAFNVNCDVSNTGALDAFVVSGTLTIPAGFSGGAPQSYGTVAAGAKVSRTFALTASSAAGVYSFTLNVTGAGYGESFSASAKFNVGVNTSAPPALGVDPGALSFNFVLGGTAPAPQTLSVTSSSGSLSFSATTNTPWLSVKASGSSTPATVTVSIVTSAVTGTTQLNGSVTIQSGAGSQTVPVTLNVGGAPKVTLVNDLITNSVGGTGCPVPKSVTSFNATDPQAYVWFLVNGAAAGDKGSLEWYAPDGGLYLTGTWTPVASAGSWCFWSGLDIAGKPPATKPGKWSVKVYWNSAPLFTLTFNVASVVTLLNSMTTAGIPKGNGCPVPSPQNSFLTTDSSVYAWFLVDNATRGDVASIAWYQSDGTRYSGDSWDPLSDGGSWCFDESLAIAGKKPATLPGTWTAKVSWNGTVILTLTFTINPPVIVESFVTSKLQPSGSGCVAPPPSTSFVPTDPIALIWFEVSKANAGDVASIEFYAPDGSFYNSATFDPLGSGGNWCFWSWNDVAGNDIASLFGTWTAKIYWNKVPILTVPFNLVPVNVINSMMTKALPPGNGCPTPDPATTFLPGDKQAYLWFLTSGAQPGDVPAVNFITPSGSTYFETQWDPVPDTQNRCFWASINIAGTAAANQLGTWTVQTTWNGTALETATFNLARTDPGTPTSLSTMQRADVEEEPVSNGAGQATDTNSPGVTIPRLPATGRRNIGVSSAPRL
jgi:serine protease AprX